MIPIPFFSYIVHNNLCLLGTTWMQELVWLTVNNCDFEKAKKTQLSIRSPFLEMDYLLPRAIADKFEREAILRYTN